MKKLLIVFMAISAQAFAEIPNAFHKEMPSSATQAARVIRCSQSAKKSNPSINEDKALYYCSCMADWHMDHPDPDLISVKAMNTCREWADKNYQ